MSAQEAEVQRVRGGRAGKLARGAAAPAAVPAVTTTAASPPLALQLLTLLFLLREPESQLVQLKLRAGDWACREPRALLLLLLLLPGQLGCVLPRPLENSTVAVAEIGL